MDERELLKRLQQALGSAEVDAQDLVEEAWTDARDEVYATLKRLMTNDLLVRALRALGDPVPGADAEVGRLATSTVQGRDTGRMAVPPQSEPVGSPGQQRLDAASTERSAPGSRSQDPPTPSGADSAMTYLFGIVGPDTDLPDAALPALPGGGELRFIDGPGCRALVSDVDPELFEVLREPSTDGLELLADAARAHDGILARFADRAVLPLGLGTALIDDAAVESVLSAHATQLQAELARVEGHAEWAVSVHTPEVAEPDRPSTEPTTSGREYLQSRRAALDARDARWERQDRLASELHGPLAACAVASERVESRPLEETAPPLLHGVYLLDEEAHARFESTITYLRGEHPQAVIEVSGPWPPYHFVSLNLAVDGVDGS